MSDVNKMEKHKKYSTALMLIMLITIVIKIYFQYNNRPLIMIPLLSLIAVMIINGYIRNVKLKNETKYICISLLFNICAASILQYLILGVSTTIYMYCVIFQILELEKKFLKILLSVHALLYFSAAIFNGILSGSENFLFNLVIQILAYSATTGMLYNLKKLEREKEEIKQLNEKLKLSNIKLQKYVLEVEEVTISKERTRVAQELHDSLGHSLMALAMHLEFAKKICITKPQKVEEVLEQSEKIAKSSINDLRKAVTLLNSELEIVDLDTSIEKLINNFYLVSNLKITYTKNRSINDLSSIVNTSIYKTIQECITNSLKHGNATEINIKITASNENVEFIVTDNGKGCNNIVKSNGLNGIENRIHSLGGTTYYFSHNDLGFGIKVLITI
ncbi:two-component sensor histidine kinase [Clostridium gelidum]|uniref:histidine kinase n=1 Tax=Clostridium gelidum TaxID=704125 RepID=A0ABM7SZI9_9CLOT|nr:sensor histidine kinase [Clostridium gelidum]BCZ45056.1 two-component sensor histidine kinase [Clostridium gelidum]